MTKEPQPQGSILDLDLDRSAIVDLAEFADTIAVDTEGYDLLGFSLAFKTSLGSFSTYLPWKHLDLEEENDQALCLKFWQIARTKTLVFHNAGFDIPQLAKHGFLIAPGQLWYDTMSMEHWLNENLRNYSLDQCSIRHGGMPKNRPVLMQFIIDTQGWEYVPVSLMTEYSAHDALITLELFYKLIDQFKKEFDEGLWREEMKFILIMAKMKAIGIMIDPVVCLKKIIQGEKIMNNIEAKLHFNPASPKALTKFFFDELDFPVLERTEKGKPSFNKHVMEQYDTMLEGRQDPRAKLVLEYRGWQKAVSAGYRAYLSLADAGVLHPSYKLHGTKTGRLSCEKPNLQQIPRESVKPWNGDMKKVFVPRPGFNLWEFDYNQLEFRLAAAYSEEELLMEVFHDPNRNLFREMAEELGWDYDRTKRFNYSSLYGGGANNTSLVFNVSMPQAKAMINKYHRRYPKLKETQDTIARLARQRKFVRYWTGRRRHNVEPHKAMNSVIQGGAAEIVKRAIIKLDEEVCNEECYMLLQIHDAVVFEIAEGKEDHYLPIIEKIMTTPPIDFNVPFPVAIKPFGGKMTVL